MTAEPARGVTASLLRGYVRLFPDEAARAMDEAPPREAAELLAAQPASRAVEVLRRLSPEQGASVLSASAGAGAARLLERLEAGRGAALLARLPPEERERLLGELSPQAARELEELGRYPPDTAGALMDPWVAAFRGETRAGHVLTQLRRQRARRILDVFVVGPDGRLEGVV
jgi:magnesium transporter